MQSFFEKKEPDRIILEDVFKAYYDCRRHKRRTVNAIKFELEFEKELLALWREINAGTYKISRSIAFVVKYPLKREVFAADFRDRIVHHLVINKINPLIEKALIPDTYSCREGKGTLYAARRVKEMLQACQARHKKGCYILKLDIRSFFMSIDKPLLYQHLALFLNDQYTGSDKPILLKLIRQIIFNRPENRCIIKGQQKDWNGLPYYKSLFWAESTKGLPIGNLTSQIFANFYLSQLDRFVTQELGIKDYGRYVDDFVLIHEDKEVLKQAHKAIEVFLRDKLKLTLHPQKVYLQHASKGVRFVGAFIKQDHIIIGRRTKGNLYRRIHEFLPQMAESLGKALALLTKFSSSVNSYLGFMRHYSTYRLRAHIIKKLEATFLAPVFKKTKDAKKLSIEKMFRESAQKERDLRSAKRSRKYYSNKRKQQIYERKESNT